MTKRHLLGKRGEKLAKAYFLNQRFEIVCENYRYRRFEIDLIVKKGGLLVFVEVKTRTSIRFGYPEETLSVQQENRIRKAAEEYIFTSGWQGKIRFDIISIVVRKNRAVLRHFVDALY